MIIQKKSLIFYNGDYSDKLLEHLILNKNKDFYLINIGNKLLKLPTPINTILVDINDIFNENEIIEITKELLSFTLNWHKFSIKSNKLIDNYFCEYLQFNLKIVFTKMIKYISVLKKLLPNEVVIFNDESVVVNTIIKYCEKNQIKIEIFNDYKLSSEFSQKKYEWPLNFKLKGLKFKALLKNIFYSFKHYIISKSIHNVYIESHKFTDTLLTYGIENNDVQIHTNTTSIKTLLKRRHIFFSEKLYTLNPFAEIHAHTRVKSLLINSKISKTSYYENINLFEIVYSTFYLNLIESFKYFSVNHKYVIRYFNKHNIKHAILMQDSVGLNKIIQMNSKNKYITYMYLHGIPGIFFNSELKFNTDFILTFGKYTTEYFNKHYCNVISVGNIYFSNYKNFNNTIDFKSNKTVLLIAEPITNFYIDEEPYFQNLILTNYCNVAKENKDILFILRFHPSTKYYESLETKIKIVNSFNLTNLIVDYTYELPKLLNSIQIIVSNSSTVAFESLFFNKTFICYDPLRKDVAKYIEFKAGIGVYNESELNDCIREVFNNNNFKKTIQNNSIDYLSNAIEKHNNKSFVQNFFDKTIFLN
jgi:hypothetical protein